MSAGRELRGVNDLEAVLFDLDGTICVQDQDDDELLAAAFDRVGAERSLDPQHLYDVDTATLPTATDSREFFELLFEAAATEAGSGADVSTVRAAGRAFEEIRDPTAVSFRPGAREALTAAQDAYQVGLVTNGGEALQTGKLDALGIRNAFDVSVFCDPVAGVDPKPDPTPIEMVLDEFGVVPGRSLLVGDDHGADVVGAHNAGAKSAWVPYFGGPGRSEGPDPTHVFESMDEVAAALRQ